jgi:hypothetical protein
MADVKISQLPAGTASANAVVPATNAAGTTTEKITLGAIAALGGGAPAAHESTHRTGGSDPIANVVVSPSQITVSQNDYNPGTGDIFRLDADAARDITGIVAGANGRAILLINVGSHAITLKHESASSSANNRITVPWGGDFILSASGGAALLVYLTASNRWRAV